MWWHLIYGEIVDFSDLEMQLQQLMVFIATVEVLAVNFLCIAIAVELQVANVTC